MQKNENRKGYKKTKVGWIPADWKASCMGKHIDLLTGYPFKSSIYTDSLNDVKLLRGDNVIQGELRWENVKRWPIGNSAGLENFELMVGDFVIAMDRTWVKSGLKVSIVTENDLPCLLVQRVARLRATKSLHPYFMSTLIRRYHFEQYVKNVQTDSIVPHISSRQIHEFPIPLPPLPEQKAIADVLECWDRAIKNLELLKSGRLRNGCSSGCYQDGFAFLNLQPLLN